MKITLKDGKELNISTKKTVADIALGISEGLARVALAAIISNDTCAECVVGMDTVIDKDCALTILTDKDSEVLPIYRHTAAHILAQAVKKLYPSAKLGVGPCTDNGYYYDIDFLEPITQDDLAKIELEMNNIMAAKLPIKREVVTKKTALDIFKRLKEDYKVKLINSLNDSDTISIYRQGEFVDLCRGPHLVSTDKVKFVKLIQMTGAYWQGEQTNKMLTRIYGVAFFKKAELEEHLEALQEAKSRDHNKLGRELGIFITDEKVGQGLPLFTPKGARVMQTLIRWVEDEEYKRGYQLTRTPVMAKSDLYEVSGHWQHYKDGMFVMGDKDNGYMAMRPMTCPFQYSIYKSQMRSYRDLPIRYAETSPLFRNENSGEMHGLIRIRQFTLSDGHILCTPKQVEQEFDGCLSLVNYLLTTIGLDKAVTYRLSKHDPSKKDKYIDNPKMWQASESQLKNILDKHNIKYDTSIGDAAFYGPKLDIQTKNVYGKEDTIITIQIDMALSERFDLEYTDDLGVKQRPVIIHRSSIGCYERTLALLIEKYAGALPLWLAPIQVKVMSLTDRTIPQVNEYASRLIASGILVETDNRQEKLGYKIRQAQLEKIPYMLVIGDKEAQDGTVSVRTRKGGDLGVMSQQDALNTIVNQIKLRDNTL